LLQDPELQLYHSPYTPMAVSYAIGHACTKANFSFRTKELVMELCAKHLAEVFLLPFERLLDLLSDQIPQVHVGKVLNQGLRTSLVVKPAFIMKGASF